MSVLSFDRIEVVNRKGEKVVVKRSLFSCDFNMPKHCMKSTKRS